MSKALLYDSTVCIGCKQCEQACATQNKLPYNDTIAAEEIQSAHKMTAVLTRGDKFMRRLCMNCNDPSCASVCPVGRSRKRRSVPSPTTRRSAWAAATAWWRVPSAFRNMNGESWCPKVQKCTMCPDRVAAGKQTACAEICPTGATKFGERDDLIAEAQKRIRDNPGNYVDHIYGLEEVGGTSVLLLSAVPFETFGYRSNLSKDPMPMLTYRVLSHIPDFVPLGGMVLGGIWWITHRREEVALAEGPKPVAEKKNGRKP